MHYALVFWFDGGGVVEDLEFCFELSDGLWFVFLADEYHASSDILSY
jgi:hypothetical protein